MNFDPKVDREKESEQDLEQKAEGLLWVCCRHGTGGKAEHQWENKENQDRKYCQRQAVLPCGLREGEGHLHWKVWGKGLQRQALAKEQEAKDKSCRNRVKA